MPTMQIRKVPEETSRALKVRAAAAGQSLSDYLLAELTKVAERPTLQELTERIARMGGNDLPPAPRGVRVAEVLAAQGEVHAPHLLITGTLSVLRGWVRGRKIDQRRAATAGADLAQFPVHLWDARALTPRVWALRANLSAYDATYVALAEVMGCALVTGAARMARAVGDDLTVHVVP